MKNFKIITLSIITSLLFFTSCEKEEDGFVEEVKGEQKTENAVIEVTHNYTYKSEKFSVVYTFDTKGEEVLEVEGDIAMAEEVFGKENPEQALYFPITETEAESKDVIDIVVFDSFEELKEYQNEEEKTLVTRQSKKNKSFCYDHTMNGEASVRFYHDIFLQNEMTFIRQNNISFRQDFDLGGLNDRLSSFEVRKQFGSTTSVYLFEHGCFRGRSYTFSFMPSVAHAGVFDLRTATLSGWWFWRKSWNDQASSFRVWDR
ncbi:hypothetical protein D1818_21055 [Aquimarina sp. BL5]|uniref:hypothetical protein n=1 Tax=Aquimarina sp. BL5 TaxID=1714860 RepID=UPI000E512994|nr:hypothetical protein [Aquimarina sp. BL5]AXT53195.1 hypothetical protein D1818_21055 [Aquimarina sp. BL5]RKN02883.1 hypothetical protein D7036_15560 [Aquimarina sp. BL5]